MADLTAPSDARPGATRLAASDDVTIRCDDVHVTYRVYEDRRPQIKDLFKRGFRNRDFRAIHAVRGVDFTAHEGEAIGIVGRNGSGKSTLLQAMAGLLPTDQGDVFAVAQPTLLGVGAALNPKVSGRRNIELGLLALGMSGDAVEELTPEVTAFAGLEDFIDLPLRAYSSGMRARLHFSIATAVKPRILLIDEALAVGDAGFRRKSERRIEELLDSAGTVFLVSHSETAVRGMCNRALWLHQGEMRMDDDIDTVFEAYNRFTDDETEADK